MSASWTYNFREKIAISRVKHYEIEILLLLLINGILKIIFSKGYEKSYYFLWRFHHWIHDAYTDPNNF